MTLLIDCLHALFTPHTEAVTGSKYQEACAMWQLCLEMSKVKICLSLYLFMTSFLIYIHTICLVTKSNVSTLPVSIKRYIYTSTTIPHRCSGWVRAYLCKTYTTAFYHGPAQDFSTCNVRLLLSESTAHRIRNSFAQLALNGDD